MESKFPVLQKWQFDLIKRLPTSKENIEKILKEEFSLDFEGNEIKQREVLKLKRKKVKTLEPTDIEVLPDASLQ